jgi:hypothetical protein
VRPSGDRGAGRPGGRHPGVRRTHRRPRPPAGPARHHVGHGADRRGQQLRRGLRLRGGRGRHQRGGHGAGARRGGPRRRCGALRRAAAGLRVRRCAGARPVHRADRGRAGRQLPGRALVAAAALAGPLGRRPDPGGAVARPGRRPAGAVRPVHPGRGPHPPGRAGGRATDGADQHRPADAARSGRPRRGAGPRPVPHAPRARRRRPGPAAVRHPDPDARHRCHGRERRERAGRGGHGAAGGRRRGRGGRPGDAVAAGAHRYQPGLAVGVDGDRPGPVRGHAVAGRR